MSRERLADRVRKRRLELGLSVRAAAKAAGVDRATWGSLEDSTRATRTQYFAGIERALEWAAGSCEVILDGGEPALGGVTAAVSGEQRVDDARAEILSATPGDLIKMRRLIEEVRGAVEADAFLRQALEMQRQAREQRPVTRRDVS
jgi:transcriptional regulator with XRE-family HTH domain